MRSFQGIFLCIISLVMTGCVNMKVLPKNHTMPDVNPHEIFVQDSLTVTPWLDCLSGMLGEEKTTFKITVDSIPNTFGNQAGISLPKEFRPLVETSMKRITNGYLLFDIQALGGMRGLSTSLPLSSADVVTPTILGDFVKADIVLSGSLFLAQELKSAAIGAEVFYTGLQGEVKAYDVVVQLKAKDASNGRFLVQHTLKVRIYSAEHGFSVFSLKGGELTQAQTSFFRSPSMSDGLQTLSDFLVAATIRDLSTALFGRSYSSCNREIPGRDNSRLPIQSHNVTHYSTDWLDWVSKPDEGYGEGYCLFAREGSYTPQVSLNGQYQVRINQYSSRIALNIPIHPSLVLKRISGSQLRNEGVCFYKSALDWQAINIECEVRNEQDEIVGTTVIAF